MLAELVQFSYLEYWGEIVITLFSANKQVD